MCRFSWLRWGRPGGGDGGAGRAPSSDDGLGEGHLGETDPDEPVVVPIEDFIDLHTFLPREAKDVTASYLSAAAEAGMREVRVIHGKGTGALRRTIHALLARDPHVERFETAPPERGGWGATRVWLRPLQGHPPPGEGGSS